MPPRRAVLRRLELVCLGLAWSKRTFSYAVCAILLVAVELSDAMPVDSSAVVR